MSSDGESGSIDVVAASAVNEVSDGGGATTSEGNTNNGVGQESTADSQTMSTNKAVSDQQPEEESSSGLVAAGVEGPGESSIAPKSSTKKAVEGGNTLTSASEAQTPSTNVSGTTSQQQGTASKASKSKKEKEGKKDAKATQIEKLANANAEHIKRKADNIREAIKSQKEGLTNKQESSDDEQEDDKVLETSPNGNYYKVNKEIGRGSFKAVYRGMDANNGVSVAWCELLPQNVTRNDRLRFKEEANMLKNLQHPNIVRFYDYWEAPREPKTSTSHAKRSIVIITELMTSGTLKKYIGRFKSRLNTRVVKSWCRQILKGLAFLHSRSPPIIHRDLKCDNIFITGATSSVKIGDLGLATLKSQSYAKSVIGTPEFMAPEMYDEEYDEGVDVYAFGMCLLEMTTNEYPYKECAGPAQIYRKVVKGERPQCFDKVDSPEFKALIDHCTKARKEERPTIKQLLNHEFFEDPGFALELCNRDAVLEQREHMVTFRLRFTDPKKQGDKIKGREALHGSEAGGEAIEFNYNLDSDNVQDVAQDMYKNSYFNSESDCKACAKVMENQINNLLKERNENETKRNEQQQQQLKADQEEQQQKAAAQQAAQQAAQAAQQQQQQQQAAQAAAAAQQQTIVRQATPEPQPTPPPSPELQPNLGGGMFENNIQAIINTNFNNQLRPPGQADLPPGANENYSKSNDHSVDSGYQTSTTTQPATTASIQQAFRQNQQQVAPAQPTPSTVLAAAASSTANPQGHPYSGNRRNVLDNVEQGHTDSDLEGERPRTDQIASVTGTGSSGGKDRNRTKSRTRRKPKVKVISSTPFPESSVGDVSAPVEDVRVVCSMEPTKAQGKIQFEFSTSDVDAEEICRTFVIQDHISDCYRENVLGQLSEILKLLEANPRQFPAINIHSDQNNQVNPQNQSNSNSMESKSGPAPESDQHQQLHSDAAAASGGGPNRFTVQPVQLVPAAGQQTEPVVCEATHLGRFQVRSVADPVLAQEPASTNSCHEGGGGNNSSGGNSNQATPTATVNSRPQQQYPSEAHIPLDAVRTKLEHLPPAAPAPSPNFGQQAGPPVTTPVQQPHLQQQQQQHIYLQQFQAAQQQQVPITRGVVQQQLAQPLQQAHQIPQQVVMMQAHNPTMGGAAPPTSTATGTQQLPVNDQDMEFKRRDKEASDLADLDQNLQNIMGSKTAQPGIPSSVSTSVPNTGTPSGGGQPPSFPGQQPQPQSQQPQPQVQPQQVDPTASSGQPAAGRFSISPVVESRPITQTEPAMAQQQHLVHQPQQTSVEDASRSAMPPGTSGGESPSPAGSNYTTASEGGQGTTSVSTEAGAPHQQQISSEPPQAASYVQPVVAPSSAGQEHQLQQQQQPTAAAVQQPVRSQSPVAVVPPLQPHQEVYQGQVMSNVSIHQQTPQQQPQQQAATVQAVQQPPQQQQPQQQHAAAVSYPAPISATATQQLQEQPQELAKDHQPSSRSQQRAATEELDNPVKLSEIIRALDEKHRQEVMEHNQKLEAMRREYLNERQELSIRLVSAVQNQEVKPDSSVTDSSAKPAKPPPPPPSHHDTITAASPAALAAAATAQQAAVASQQAAAAAAASASCQQQQASAAVANGNSVPGSSQSTVTAAAGTGSLGGGGAFVTPHQPSLHVLPYVASDGSVQQVHLHPQQMSINSLQQFHLLQQQQQMFANAQKLSMVQQQQQQQQQPQAQPATAQQQQPTLSTTFQQAPQQQHQQQVQAAQPQAVNTQPPQQNVLPQQQPKLIPQQQAQPQAQQQAVRQQQQPQYAQPQQVQPQPQVVPQQYQPQQQPQQPQTSIPSSHHSQVAVTPQPQAAAPAASATSAGAAPVSQHQQQPGVQQQQQAAVVMTSTVMQQQQATSPAAAKLQQPPAAVTPAPPQQHFAIHPQQPQQPQQTLRTSSGDHPQPQQPQQQQPLQQPQQPQATYYITPQGYITAGGAPVASSASVPGAEQWSAAQQLQHPQLPVAVMASPQMFQAAPGGQGSGAPGGQGSAGNPARFQYGPLHAGSQLILMPQNFIAAPQGAPQTGVFAAPPPQAIQQIHHHQQQPGTVQLANTSGPPAPATSNPPVSVVASSVTSTSVAAPASILTSASPNPQPQPQQQQHVQQMQATRSQQPTPAPQQPQVSASGQVFVPISMAPAPAATTTSTAVPQQVAVQQAVSAAVQQQQQQGAVNQQQRTLSQSPQPTAATNSQPQQPQQQQPPPPQQ